MLPCMGLSVMKYEKSTHKELPEKWFIRGGTLRKLTYILNQRIYFSEVGRRCWSWLYRHARWKLPRLFMTWQVTGFTCIWTGETPLERANLPLIIYVLLVFSWVILAWGMDVIFSKSVYYKIIVLQYYIIPPRIVFIIQFLFLISNLYN